MKIKLGRRMTKKNYEINNDRNEEQEKSRFKLNSFLWALLNVLVMKFKLFH